MNTLQHHLWHTACIKGVGCWSALVLLLNVMEAASVCWNHNTKFFMLQNSESKDIVYQGILKLSFGWSLRQLFECGKTFVWTQKIEQPLSRHLYRTFYHNLMANVDCEYLHVRRGETLNSAIRDGVRAMISTLEFAFKFVNPILQTIGTMLILTQKLNTMLVGATLVCTALTWVVGMKVLQWEYNQREKTNLETNSIESQNNYLANNFLYEMLDGFADKAVYKLTRNSMLKNKKHLDITFMTKLGYTLNELCSLMMIYVLSTQLVQKKPGLILAAYTVITNCINNAWWLFHMFNTAAKSAAEWSPMERALDMHRNPPQNTTPALQVSLPTAREYHIAGESGAGKSTWMLRQVISLYYARTDSWVYFDQNMSIDPNTKNIREYFHEECESVSVERICYWASKLKLEHKIHLGCMDSKFKGLSGGEQKRICVLRKLIPILERKRTVKYIFCDEVTSGIDVTLRNEIRNLFQYVMNLNHSSILFWIDHHEHDGPVTHNKFCRLRVKSIGTPQQIKINTNKSRSTCGYSKKKKNEVVLFYAPKIVASCEI